jgi:hypothetical protein
MEDRAQRGQEPGKKKKPPDTCNVATIKNHGAVDRVELGDLLATARAGRVARTLEYEERDDPKHSAKRRRLSHKWLSIP